MNKDILKKENSVNYKNSNKIITTKEIREQTLSISWNYKTNKKKHFITTLDVELDYNEENNNDPVENLALKVEQLSL
ncbi:hypothetical protein PVAND_004911 [Polypedilum vanderplanki]|uniref:Uncharacterized protein n=1 Tax=Polypedilum vanderplanki TaxID=319348 RepID=A0A9J6BYN7_POLVA|nr:hypothetical protein PVAND_004911 [Polypedilum vanderplanki]